MQTPPTFWPRGLLAGALLAALLIIPVFGVMLFDSAAGTSRVFPDANGRFALFQRPIQMRASGAFFGGKLGVDVLLSQRFAVLPHPAPAKAVAERHEAFDGDQPTGTARSSMFRLRLENHSAEDLQVEIVRVDSSLGNLAGQPRHVILAPHQSASIDTLVPDQKVSGGSIPVRIALRVGSSVETHPLLLNQRYLAQVWN